MMSGGRRMCLWALCLALAAGLSFGAAAQRGGGRGGNLPSPLTDPNAPKAPKGLDPESRDAIELYSHLCVSTRGDRARAIGIVGEGDTAIEKMNETTLRQFENVPGGIGWIIRMPLGEKLLLEYPPGGGCIVRAPRVNQQQFEMAFRNLLDQYSASGEFIMRRLADQEKSIDMPVQTGAPARPAENLLKTKPQMKLHLIGYVMSEPGGGESAELTLLSTDSTQVQIQGTLTYQIQAAKP